MCLAGMPWVPFETARRNQSALGGLNAYLNVYGLFSTAKYRLFSQDMWRQLGDHNPYEDLGLDPTSGRSGRRRAPARR
jgi:hypothetical protein